MQAEFELNIAEDIARPLMCKNWSQFLRSRKSRLRAYISNGGVEAPEGIDPIIWEKFLENENDPKKMKQKHDNSQNRKQNTVSHTLGRQSYSQKAHLIVSISHFILSLAICVI